jgi:ribosomal protein S18 acetylase RimI-like enzyme
VTAAAQVVRMRWLESADGADGAVRGWAYRLVSGVMAQGGAVGWLGVPTRAECDEWLDGVLASVAAGRTRAAVVLDGGGAGPIQAMGRWTRYDKPTVSLNAEILQVMVHPEARGRRLARVLVRALVADARAHRIETLTLDVRGNNHGAMVLYEAEGFEVYGRLPDFVAVGGERWDRVLYRLDLRNSDTPVRRHGSRPVGPGSSTMRALSGHPPFPGPALSGPGCPA